MGKASDSPVILIGFSGTGKSAVARGVASRLGWQSIDTDDEVVRLAGKGIPEIFDQHGEQYFRKLERRSLAEACRKARVVIATGGGVVLDPDNRDLMRRSGVVVCLEALPDTIYRRLSCVESNPDAVRPLLKTVDPLERIIDLKKSRQPYYAIADWTVQTDCLTLDEVCQEVMRGRQYWLRRHRMGGPEFDGDVACHVVTATENYPVYVGWGLLESLGGKIRQAGLSGTVFVVADATVLSLYGDKVISSLEKMNLSVRSFAVAPGETGKTLDTASRIYDWLVDCRAERGDVVVALGGGMIGDLAGFVAATFLRGLSLVQVPTSLVAMVDASVGGKTAVNHPRAKNLIGVFYQPRLVMADVQTLTTLPEMELTSGWAEVIKHGLVLDRELYSFLRKNVNKLAELDPETTTLAVRYSTAIKAGIVSEDEKEQGRRILLNYGHTIGHALEAATDYRQLLHGEAVSIGMVGEAMISHALGMLSREAVEQHRSILAKFGLPVACPGMDVGRVLKAMELDKKVRAKAIRWVLLEDIGRPVVRQDVPDRVVVSVLEMLFRSG